MKTFNPNPKINLLEKTPGEHESEFKPIIPAYERFQAVFSILTSESVVQEVLGIYEMISTKENSSKIAEINKAYY